ncbi:LysR family transcriptional regulator [Variovorax sp. J2P1-59]|uniref:LysR family transcriptional regulator n=1 Tax=Variovorax flavidus TaxID=3053501 RepID=UPI002576AEF9|nr:LysR family transcriptional regulator [Variovorax sp. J2P1-59]MDM0075526.1 LysR family transcriptional regulator [Variovorax sp. J2P1-59]
MDTLRAIRAFLNSVELGSLSGAARAMDTTQPTISKLLASLEHELGARLLQRASSRLALTDEGLRFHERAQRLVEDYDEALADVHAQTHTPRGLLRLSAPRAMGEGRVNAMAMAFLDMHPAIELELLLDDRFVDPLEERIDVSLRLGGPLPPNLVARYVGSWPRWLVAAPRYVALHGMPRKPDELANHAYIRYAPGADDGLVLHHDRNGRSVQVTVRSRYRLNSAVAMLDCVRQGAGISLQPSWAVADLVAAGELVRVLPPYSGPAQHAHLLYAPRRQQPLRVRMLVEFLTERLEALPGRRLVEPKAMALQATR